MKITLKKAFYAILIVLFAIVVYNYELVNYGLGQARGQFKVLWNARPIAEVLEDPNFPDSLKGTLRHVGEIKQFAVDALGLNANDNYTKVYDQQGKEILWVVTACARYKLEPVMWSFPVIGAFTYKGFFDRQKAVELAKKLNDEGYDISMRSVSGWSTLGWFNDPILSNMLDEGTGSLANTIIHELVHGTIFVPDSMTFNENLATFIGNRGALAYLQVIYGDSSAEYRNYKLRKRDTRKFTQYIVEGAKILDSLYQVNEIQPDSVKEIIKTEYIEQIAANLDTVSFADTTRFKDYFSYSLPNNAYFISFLNYRERQGEFDDLFTDSLNNDLGLFIEYWKRNYGK